MTGNAIDKPAAVVLDPFARYGAAVTSRGFDGELLRYTKGDWLSGVDGDPIAAGLQFVAIMTGLRIGWQCWRDGKPSETVTGLVAEGYVPPTRRELGDADQSAWERDAADRPRDPWQATNMLPLIERRSKRAFTFVTSSRGGIAAIGDLCNTHALRTRVETYPVIELDSNSYAHSNKEYGRIKVPVLEVVDWVDAERADKVLAAARGKPAITPNPPALESSRLQPTKVSAATGAPIFDDEIPF